MAVHQIVGRAAPASRTTEAALRLQPLLRRLGPSEIYASRPGPDLEGRILPLAEFAARPGAGPPAVVVYHAGAGDPDVLSLLLDRREPILLIYQDVPPAESFSVLQPETAHRLASGVAQLSLLQPRIQLALVDSAHTAGQLRALGYPDVRVAPLPVHLDGLREAEPHPPTWRHLQTQLEGPLLLCVGPMLPHERVDLVIQAYHALVTYLAPDVHLAVFGPVPVPAYLDVLQGFLQKLELTRAWIQPEAGVEPLAAFYRSATVFVTMSEHPGFCLPAVQALDFGLPVVGRATGGVPETLGGAGLLLPSGAGPLLLAETLAAVLDDSGLRSAIAKSGQDRLADLDPSAAEAALLGHLAELL